MMLVKFLARDLSLEGHLGCVFVSLEKATRCLRRKSGASVGVRTRFGRVLACWRLPFEKKRWTGAIFRDRSTFSPHLLEIATCPTKHSEKGKLDLALERKLAFSAGEAAVSLPSGVRSCRA